MGLVAKSPVQCDGILFFVTHLLSICNVLFNWMLLHQSVYQNLDPFGILERSVYHVTVIFSCGPWFVFQSAMTIGALFQLAQQEFHATKDLCIHVAPLHCSDLSTCFYCTTNIASFSSPTFSHPFFLHKVEVITPNVIDIWEAFEGVRVGTIIPICMISSTGPLTSRFH